MKITDKITITNEDCMELMKRTPDNYFDLAICCQVLEHVWNISQAIHNISRLVKISGHVWINVPSSNMKHASPHYYSAGYQSEMIAKLFELNSFSLTKVA